MFYVVHLCTTPHTSDLWLHVEVNTLNEGVCCGLNAGYPLSLGNWKHNGKQFQYLRSRDILCWKRTELSTVNVHFYNWKARKKVYEPKQLLISSGREWGRGWQKNNVSQSWRKVSLYNNGFEYFYCFSLNLMCWIQPPLLLTLAKFSLTTASNPCNFCQCMSHGSPT